MELENIKKIIDEAIRLNTSKIVITGGEPLLHPKFNELLNLIKRFKEEYKLWFFLRTNGDLISLEKIKSFDFVQIDYDPLNSVRSKVMIEKLKTLPEKVQKKVFLFITIYKNLALKILNDVIWFKSILQELKSYGFKVGFNFYIGTKKELLLDKSLKLKVLWVLNKIACEGLIEKPHDVFSWLVRPELRKIKNRIAAGCTAGIVSGIIDVYGNFYPCPFLRIPVGNVFKDGLENIWKNSEVLWKLRYRDFCRDCEYRWVCGGCRARAFLFSKNIFGKDPFCPLQTPYNDLASIYDKNFSSKFIVKRVLHTLEALNIKFNKVLEFGCGTGEVLKLLKEKHPHIEVWGVDISQKMIEIARKKIPDGVFIVGDMRYIYLGEKFDLILSIYDVINNIPSEDIEFFFKNVYEHLCEEGYFIFDFLNENFKSVDEKIVKKDVDRNKVQFNVSVGKKIVRITEYLYSKDQILHFLQRAGFLVTKIEDVTSDRTLVVAKKSSF